MENTVDNKQTIVKNSNTTPATVAEQIVDTLATAGVERIYAITGDSLNALTDAISRDGRIKFIHVRNEEAAAFAASAEAQLTGRLAVCAGSSGPGHVHLINGLYDAQRSNAPVLAIASTCTSAMFGTGYFQETDPTLLFSNCSVYNHTAVTSAQVPVMLHGAMQTAVSRGGVGVVGLPADVITMPPSADGASTLPCYTDRLPKPTDDDIAECVKMINSASSVAIFVGNGAAGAVDYVRQLADVLNAPVITTYKSQMELSRDMPNYVGHMGYLGMWSAVDAIAAADLVIIIGTNFPYPGFFPDNKKAIQVDVRPERLGKRAKIDIGVRADATLFLASLLPQIERKSDDSLLKKALADYDDIKQKMAQPVTARGVKGAIRPEYMLAMLDRLAADNCIVTVDTGMNNVWTSHYLTPGRDRKMLGSFTHGSMANALPMAIGATLTCPGRQVISISGDGGLAMLMGEMLTVAQYRLPVKLLVADNRALGFVKWEMELAGFKPSEVSLANPDFAQVARAMGFEAQTVSDPADLEQAMKVWLAADGPALLSVVTDTDAASFTFSQKLMDSAAPGNPLSNFIVLGQ